MRLIWYEFTLHCVLQLVRCGRRSLKLESNNSDHEKDEE